MQTNAHHAVSRNIHELHVPAVRLHRGTDLVQNADHAVGEGFLSMGRVVSHHLHDRSFVPARTPRTPAVQCRTMSMRMSIIAAITVSAASMLMASCASPSAQAPSDPLADARNARLPPERRAQAVVRAGDDARQGRAHPGEVRDSLKAIAWDTAAPLLVRREAVQALLASEPDLEDTRRVVRLMLPHEPDLGMVHFLGDIAVERAWQDATPALVRRYSRPARTIPDAMRPERAALEALNPGFSSSEIAYRVFLNPGAGDGAPGHDWPAATRADAWDLAARLDRDGHAFASMLDGKVEADAQGQAILDILRAGKQDLGVIPRAGRELAWLQSLRDPRNADHARWWNQAAHAVASLSPAQRDGLRLRHIESIRWAAAHRPHFLRASREELLSEIEQSFAGRRRHPRSRDPGDTGPLRSERYEDARVSLSWPDALSILIIDEVIREEGVRATLFAQAAEDRADRTTEYGGLLFAGPEPGLSRADLYPPRPAQRAGDHAFIASPEMISAGDQALAHYHFHAQQIANSAYAGPSLEDLAYAARFGRTCLVFTSISAAVLNADLYTPDGVIIDLGELRRP